MKKRFFFQFTLSAILIILTPSLYSLNVTGGHRKDITSLVHSGDTVISSGEDGFIVIWNVREKAAMDRFQLTPYKIQTMVKHPSRAEICVVETAGNESSIISVWNYRFKYKLFSVESTEPVTFINYSAGGSYIITSGLNGSFLTLLDSGSGEILPSPDIPAASVSFAMTGRSERNMLLYQPEYFFQPEYRNNSGFYAGQLLYYDFASSSVTQSFRSSGYLFNPVIFGNGRFLAGIQSGAQTNGGLLVTDVVTGRSLGAYENIEEDALLCPAEDGFYCLNREKGVWNLYKFSVNSRGSLIVSQKLPLPFDGAEKINSIAYNGSVVFALKSGVAILDKQNETVPFAYNFQTLITEIAAAKNSIAFLTEGGELCLLPLDYRQLKDGQYLSLKSKSVFSRITAVTPRSVSDKTPDQFILWQSANTQDVPRLVQSNNPSSETSLNFLAGRFPIRSISSGYGRLLVLDSAGNSALYNADFSAVNTTASNARNAAPIFTFSSVGTMDAIFIDGDNILLCRSVINGNSPFLFVNSKTGETVPISYNAQAGLTAYAGKSGKIYAVALEQENFRIKTTVLGLTRSSSVKLHEYPGEDVNLSIAESAGTLAIACGGEGAIIYAKEETYFDRSEGLPVKLYGGEEFFLCLDSEGSITWHDNKTGRILALFRLYEDRWTLSNNREISGKILPF